MKKVVFVLFFSLILFFAIQVRNGQKSNHFNYSPKNIKTLSIAMEKIEQTKSNRSIASEKKDEPFFIIGLSDERHRNFLNENNPIDRAISYEMFFSLRGRIDANEVAKIETLFLQQQIDRKEYLLEVLNKGNFTKAYKEKLWLIENTSLSDAQKINYLKSTIEEMNDESFQDDITYTSYLLDYAQHLTNDSEVEIKEFINYINKITSIEEKHQFFDTLRENYPQTASSVLKEIENEKNN